MSAIDGQRAMSPASVDLTEIEKDLARLTEAIQSLIRGRSPDEPVAADLGYTQPASHLDDRELARIARKLLQESAARVSILPLDVFADPAWHILLDLFAAEVEGKRISISSACIASGVPSTTALRHINLLERRGTVKRIRDRHDARRHHLGLTSDFRERIRLHLQMLANTRCERIQRDARNVCSFHRTGEPK